MITSTPAWRDGDGQYSGVRNAICNRPPIPVRADTVCFTGLLSGVFFIRVVIRCSINRCHAVSA